MCVIILADKARPDEQMLDAAWAMNRDGGGMAWREENPDKKKEMQVVWKKNLTLEQIKDLNAKVPLPYVIHMRIASVDGGGIWPSLTHPFEVSEYASIDTEGRTTNPVLFHNGNWKDWEDRALEVAIRSNIMVPTGRWSDSRAIAWLSYVCGWGFMSFLPTQRGLMFAPTWLNTFSGPGWIKHTDSHGSEFWCSNDRPWKNGFQYRNDQVCKYGNCKRHDLDIKGYCPDHVGGRDRQLPAVVANGGAATQGPFPNQGEVPASLLTLELAESLYVKGKIGVNLMKGLREIFTRLDSQSPRVRRRAQQNLESTCKAVSIRRALRELGRIA